MEKHKFKERRANLFFIELIIALLFFSLSAVIILRVFASADNKQRNAALTERSIICAQSLAEVYSAEGDISVTCAEVLGAIGSGSDFTLSFNENMVPVAEDGCVKLAMHETVLSDTDAGRLSQLDMTFTAGETELYSLTCTAYMPQSV